MTLGERHRFERVEAAFHEALEHPTGEEREMFVAATCATDPETGQELRKLLAGYSRIGAANLPAPEALPRFGPWQTVRLLGRGGMGTVYLAERADGAFRMRVAVKVVPLALASPEIEQRFLRERQLIAMLDHTGIARLIDGGVSQTGLPYFAMEFIDGQNIDRYASEHGLDIRARIGLMQQVLLALEYVHTQRVLHRDLKPSNVLIDSTGRAKLLDFGIARLMDPEPGQTMTRSGIFALTPDYASPEQLRGEPLTAASDIYSAGILLSRVVAAPKSDADLAAIISKATRPQPSGRYSSAAAMAADLDRYLKGQLTAARRPKRWAMALGACAITAISAWAIWLTDHRKPRPDAVLLAPGAYESPVLTADGKWIAYAAQSRIWLRKTGETQARQLTFPPGRDSNPALSRDGATLLYEHRGDADGTPAICRLRLRDGSPAGPTEPLTPGYGPAISPDGRRFAFDALPFSGADDAVPRELRVASLASPDRSVKVRVPAILENWAWAIDSESLYAFGRSSTILANERRGFLLDANGGEMKYLPFLPRFYFQPLICGPEANGRMSVVAGFPADRQWLKFSRDSTDPAIIRHGIPKTSGCQILADGGLAVAQDFAEWRLWEILGNTTTGTFLPGSFHSTSIEAYAFPFASLDGSWLAWNAGEAGSFLRGPSGRKEQLDTPFSTPIAPDGSALAFVRYPHDTVISLPGRATLGDFEVDSIMWDVSSGGRWTLCLGSPSAPRSIAAVETATGVIHTILVDPKRDLYLATLSTDERWVLFTAERGNTPASIYAARFDSRRVTPPSEWVEIARGDYPKWSPAGDRVYYLASSGEAILTLALDPLTKRPSLEKGPQVVCTFPNPWSTKSIPAGRFRIAVTRDRLWFNLGRPRTAVKALSSASITSRLDPATYGPRDPKG